ISGSNQTLTNTSTLRIGSAATVDGAGGTPTNAYGLYLDAPTGATNNYAAIFQGGNVGMGTASPTVKLDVRGNVQIGTTGAAQELNIYQNGSTNGISLFNTSDSDAQVVQITQQSDGGKITLLGGAGAEIRSNGDSYFNGGKVGIGDTVSIASANLPAGSVVIGNGALCVDNGGDNCDDASRTAGTVYSVGADVTGIDVAENYIADDQSIEAGDLVVLD